MTLIRRDPFDGFFEDDWGFEEAQTPRMDVYEEDGSVVAELELPGLEPEEIDVQIKDNILSVETKKEEEREEDDKGYYCREISSRYYHRSVRLPSRVDENEVEAELEGGVLRVTAPKVEENEGKKIKVKKN